MRSSRSPRLQPGSTSCAARVLVAGWGISGRAVIDPLRDLGAPIVGHRRRARRAGRGRRARAATAHPSAELLAAGRARRRSRWSITSPGWRPDAPLLLAAARRGIPVWGDVEFAWRVDQAELYGPARQVAGGDRDQRQDHHHARCCTPSCAPPGLRQRRLRQHRPADARRAAARPRSEVLAVELSSFQLHWAPSVRPDAGAVLNIAEDHLDWHGGMTALRRRRRRGLWPADVAVVGLDDPVAAPAHSTAADRRLPDRRARAEASWACATANCVDRAFAEDADPRRRPTTISPPGPAGICWTRSPRPLWPARSASPPQCVGAGLAAHHRSARTARPLVARTRRASTSSTTRRPPTRMPRVRRCSRTRMSCGSRAVSSRARTVDELVAEVADAARRRGPDRAPMRPRSQQLWRDTRPRSRCVVRRGRRCRSDA